MPQAQYSVNLIDNLNLTSLILEGKAFIFPERSCNLLALTVPGKTWKLHVVYEYATTLMTVPAVTSATTATATAAKTVMTDTEM